MTAQALKRFPAWLRRVAVGLRFLVLTSALVLVIGLSGRLLYWPLLTATVGPTAYVFVAHPRSSTAKFRNALLGHGIAAAAGLGSLVAFGLLHRPAGTMTAGPSLAEVGAAVTAVGFTVFLLELVGSHHAPAAATAIIISTGLAQPGKPLLGLLLGLAVVIVLGRLVGRLPSAQASAGFEEADPDSKGSGS